MSLISTIVRIKTIDLFFELTGIVIIENIWLKNVPENRDFTHQRVSRSDNFNNAEI